METICPHFSPNFSCVFCDIKTNNKKDYKKHLLTSKHLKTQFGNKMETKCPKFPQNIENNNFICEFCEKNYKSRTGLWKHKKICKIENKIIDSNILITPELIMELIKDNKDMKQIIMEQNNTIKTLVKNGTYNINSHNKSFNLQFFLNETCKDAMNIMDFVDSIKLQLSDLENVGRLGYVEGISNIITTNLKALDITQRPIHCADKKRETIYIKDENKWEKEDEQKRKIIKAIKRVVCKSQRLIPKFKEEHPDCLKASSKFSDQYNKIIVESMGGSGDNDREKEEKIIRNISKQVIIDKNMD